MTTIKSAEELKDELSALAERIALESYSVKLDFSTESVKDVERILSAFHNEYNRTKDESGLQGIALEFAAYIVKVIESNFQRGFWSRDHRTFGPDTFPYAWQNTEIFPFGWCLKRIIDGPQDDVWSKFQALVLNKANGAA